MTQEQSIQQRRSTDRPDDGGGVHWEITRQHAKEIGELRESNARQEEVLSSVLRSQDAIRDALEKLVHRVSEPPPATDLAKLIATTVTVLMMFGALVYAYISPIREWQGEADNRLDRILKIRMDQEYKNGRLDADIEMVKDHLSDGSSHVE